MPRSALWRAIWRSERPPEWPAIAPGSTTASRQAPPLASIARASKMQHRHPPMSLLPHIAMRLHSCIVYHRDPQALSGRHRGNMPRSQTSIERHSHSNRGVKSAFYIYINFIYIYIFTATTLKVWVPVRLYVYEPDLVTLLASLRHRLGVTGVHDARVFLGIAKKDSRGYIALGIGFAMPARSAPSDC